MVSALANCVSLHLIQDINTTSVSGLEESTYLDKVDSAKPKTQSSAISITQETDRVYMPSTDPSHPIIVSANGEEAYKVVRDGLRDVVVWNPWVDKANSMADFEPKDGYKNMICIEAGSVRDWTKLEPGEAFEGGQTLSY